MRNKLFILFLALAAVCTMAGALAPHSPMAIWTFAAHSNNAKDTAQTKKAAIAAIIDTALNNKSLLNNILDSALNNKDSLTNILDSALNNNNSSLNNITDSLRAAIDEHNRAIDDSIRMDSLNRSKANGINSPVEFSAEDSMIYSARTKNAYFFGNSKVKYENMDLESQNVSLSMDSSLVRANGVTDSLGNKIGAPIFKMGADTYESDTMAFNFKTKKGLISDVYTAQEDGFLTAKIAKRDSSGVMYLKHGRYTTCDEEHPDFYIALSRAKVRPGKDVIFGPAYLVVADVPLPLAIPYGFFPFSKKYSSGFIMPTYGDEVNRGFYLKDGGYYFAINDKFDLKLTGEIYTKGSWAVAAAINYKKRYRYSGSFNFSYQDSRSGDKGMPDYTQTTSFKLQWSHRQDAKANPFNSLSANVNFATSKYEQNNLNSMYNPQAMTQSVRTSSIAYGTGFSSIGMTLNFTANIEQNMRDNTLRVTLPNLNISVSRFNPFKRKKAVGKERWYEKISMSYTGTFNNSYSAKEDEFFKANVLKDWDHDFSHSIPIQASFTLFDYLNVTPSFNFSDNMYFKKTVRSWDVEEQKEKQETVHGFYNFYKFNAALSANTKLYGMYQPNPKIFGKKIMAIRHVFTPSVSFSYSPDFTASNFGLMERYQKTDKDGNVSYVEYSPYPSTPSKMNGSISIDISNNIEMKVRTDKDSTGYKKISIIDELGASMSYNLAAKEKPLSDLNTRLKLKLSKSYTLSLNAVFATYAYDLDENGRPYIGNHTEYSRGRFGRFQGISQNINYTLNNEKLKKIFSGEAFKSQKALEEEKKRKEEEDDTGLESNIDNTMEKGKRAAHGEQGMEETDEDGYLIFTMPWSLTFGYGITISEDRGGTFNTSSMRYPYKLTHNLNISGNLQISKGWNISFSSGYDFENKRISMTTASLSRDLHCFSMSASVVLAPYTSYNFTFRCNASTLADALKYDKNSGYTNTVKWY